MNTTKYLWTVFYLLVGFSLHSICLAEESRPTKTESAQEEKIDPFKQLLNEATPLNPQKTLYLNRKEKAVYVRSIVVLNAGMLEMLCCLKQTKEHESILSTDCPASSIHTALLAIGAETGTPVKQYPEYVPPTGELMSITLIWNDEKGKRHQQDAREWIRTVTRRYFSAELAVLPAGLELPEDSDLFYDENHHELLHFGTVTAAKKKTLLKLSSDPAFQKAIESIAKASQPSGLKADWVFTGSLFVKDEQTGEERYLAEAGDVICVANFPSAMIDVAIRSSADDSARGFEANPEKVPALGTPVLIKLERKRDKLEDLKKSGND